MKYGVLLLIVVVTLFFLSFSFSVGASAAEPQAVPVVVKGIEPVADVSAKATLAHKHEWVKDDAGPVKNLIKKVKDLRKAPNERRKLR